MRGGGSGRENFINSELMQLSETRLERIREQASRGRFGLLSNYLTESVRDFSKSQAFQKGINLAPGIGDIIMAGKAIVGREGGKPLPKKERLIYATAATTEFLSVMLMYHGRFPEAGTMHVVSETISKIDAIAPLIKQAARKIAEQNPKTAHIFETVQDWLLEKKERQPVLRGAMSNAIPNLNLESNNADE